MNEDKLCNQIKHSADQVNIPEGLKPDKMEERLKASSQKRSNLLPGRKRIYQIGGAVAACLLLVFLAVQGKSTTEQPARAVSGVEGVFVTPKNYEEIHDKVFIEQENGIGGWFDGVLQEATGSSSSSVPESSQSTAADSVAASTANDKQGALDSGSHSQTNIQEAGVDEGDIVKTDGTYIYLLSDSKGLRIVKTAGEQMELVSITPLEEEGETMVEMYLDGDTVSIVTNSYETSLGDSTGSQEDAYYTTNRTFTNLYTYDITDRAKPVIKGTVSQEGSYRSSRKAGGYIYLFTDYYPNAVKDESNVESYIPSINGEVMRADDLYLSKTPDGIYHYIVISSIDITKPDQVADTKSIASESQQMYVSQENIYLCVNDWRSGDTRTEIVRFSYQQGKIKAEAAGGIEGYVNDSFSLNEHKGYLRVVTTSWDNSTGLNKNQLYVLNDELKITGRIENLAPNESIQSARFLGDAGYFVTFRQMDPLFSVDLSDPHDPRILGELKITGFSSYLHFYGENKLLGIGWEVDPNSGVQLGLKLSMFDITDPANVTEVNKLVLPEVYDCIGTYDYKSIMIDPAKNMFGFSYISGNPTAPYQRNESGHYGVFSYSDENGFAMEYTYNWGENIDFYSEVNRTRGLYINDIFYLCGERGIKSFAISRDYEAVSELNW